jgi:dihydroorotate dehydrogenase (NAD+) catalytic subunit
LGQGGITGATGALELILAGASAVAVGTGNFTNPRLPAEVSTGIGTYMEREGIGSVGELVGALKLEG